MGGDVIYFDQSMGFKDKELMALNLLPNLRNGNISSISEDDIYGEKIFLIDGHAFPECS